MGFDPLTVGLGITAATGIWNAVQGNKNQQHAQDQAQQNFGTQQNVYQDQTNYLRQHNAQMTDLIMPYLNRGGSDYNVGQDGLMQLARGGASQSTPALEAMTRAASGNTQFDNTDLFRSIKAMGAQDLNDQLVQARGSAGSLGQRFGSGEQNIEARLRARAAVGQTAAYAQAGQQAFEAAQNRALQASQGLLQNNQAQAGLQLGAYSQLGTNQGREDTRTAQLLSFLANQPTQTGIPAPQQQIIPGQNQLPGAVGDIGNLAILYPFLSQMGANTNRIPLNTPQMTPGYLGGYPTSLFNYGY